MDTNPQPRTTTAFYAQAVASFSLSLIAVSAAIVYLPAGAWIRAFLALGVLYTVTSAFTLAKVIRDQQETTSVVKRVDQPRLDKILTEHDPFRP